MLQKTDSNNAPDIIKSWVESHSDELFSWAMYKTSSKEASEDLVQETFLAAYQNFKTFEGKSEPKTWLFSILKNKIADHFRRAFRNSENTTISFNQFFDDNENWILSERPQKWKDDDEEHLLDNHEFRKTLTGCLKNLPEKWNASIILKFIEEKKSKEICQDLDLTPTNYWQMLHRAKLQLRKCLELNWFHKNDE